MAEKTYRIVMSDRCFRFKPDAIPGHAPASPGVYEFVTFDEKKQAQVLYVGLALDGTIQQSLVEHMMAKRRPTADDLFGKHKDVYFDYVARASGQEPEDLKDIAAALIAKHKPAFNSEPSPSSGRFQSVQLEEVEIL
jgi:excinuclease UvrABC nuclease subunit